MRSSQHSRNKDWILLAGLLFLAIFIFTIRNPTLTGFAVGSGSPPTISNLLLNSTSGNNRTAENLTAYWTVSDTEGDIVKNITDWRLNGDSIAVVNMPFETNHTTTNITRDFSTHTNNGTVYGVQWNATVGHDGFGAYNFNGINDYIKVPNNSSLNFSSSSFTITYWLNSSMSASNQGHIRKGSGTFNANGKGWEIRSQGNTTEFGRGNGSGVAQRASTRITPNIWHFMTATYNNATTEVKLYVDGTLKATVYSSGTYNDTYDLWIGRGHDGYFNGTLDDIKIYGRALTSGEISAIYNAQNKIISNETSKGERWQACVTPSDGNSLGSEQCSNNLTIANTPPTQDAPVLNASNVNNRTTTNLTVYNQSTYDADDDTVKNIIDWRINGTSYDVLNLPFAPTADSTITTDFSTYKNNATVNTTYAKWDNTTCLFNDGCYNFNQQSIAYTNVTITTPKISLGSHFTVASWVKWNKLSDYEEVVGRELQADGTFTLVSYADGHLAWGIGDTTWRCYAATPANTLNAGTWYFLTGTYDNNTCTLYINGVENQSSTYAGVSVNNYFGIGARYWIPTIFKYPLNGTIDEVRIYNRTLSSEQIRALYENKSSVIARNETSKGERWQACVTPSDGNSLGSEQCSNNLTIANTPPAKPTLTNPANDAVLTDRTPTFNWTATDIDNDALTYNLLLSNSSSFSNIITNITTTDNNYTQTTDLGFNYYYWKIIADDGSAANESAAYNFTTIRSVGCSLPINSINFGSLTIGNSKNTTSDNPPPIIMQNDGNLLENISVNATPFFTSTQTKLSDYQFMIAPNSSNPYTSALDDKWYNLTVNLTHTITELKYPDTNDSVKIHMKIRAPYGETLGQKNSTINVQCGEAE